MQKHADNRAWFLVAPVFCLVAFNAFIPLMTVVNYSLQDTFGNNQFFWNGALWYAELLNPGTELGERFYGALGRSLSFSAIVLAIEVPLGLMVSLSMPKRGLRLALCLVLMALPLLLPWNVVGIIWQLYARDNIGLFGWAVNAVGIPFNYTNSGLASWIVLLMMDVWHWTSLIALLCYAGLRAIPDAYYQAAKIDGASRWLVFIRIELPKLAHVLTIGILLRFMDSFMIYTEPFVVTGGGPGSDTTFLSVDLVKIALGQFDLGKAGAMSIVYTLITLVVCWLFYTAITTRENRETAP